MAQKPCQTSPGRYPGAPQPNLLPRPAVYAPLNRPYIDPDLQVTNCTCEFLMSNSLSLPTENDIHRRRITVAGLLVTLGIIFGDIGTSPLYVFQTIIGPRPVSELLVYGGVSAVFWTLTLQTTIKYIMLTLEADNHGEGGIFSLFSLVKSRGRWLLFPAIIGAGTLLADGIITPPISVTSAIEGLKILYPALNQETIVIVVLVIISLLFGFQQFGTKIVGAAFGPIMLVWFSVIGTLGLIQIAHHPG